MKIGCQLHCLLKLVLLTTVKPGMGKKKFYEQKEW